MARSEPKQPDLILLLVDSLRADHVGCNGYPKETTPVMDTLAKNGATFTQAYASASWTMPSVMSLFTSVPPDLHLRMRADQPNRHLRAKDVFTLAELLQNAGYQTIGVTANPMTNRKFGYAKGFDHYDDYTVALSPDESSNRKGAMLTASSPTLNRLAESALARRDPKRPFFLFIHYMDVHWDYHPPLPFYQMFTDDPIPARQEIWSLNANKTTTTPVERERILAAYDGEIRYTDTHIGQLLKTIETSPRGKNTAIAICADHGESFWERGVVGHGNNLYEEELHVPLIIRPPEVAKLAKGVVVSEQVGLIDVPPTFLDFAGIDIPVGWHGKSLRPFFTGGAVPERPLVLDNRANAAIIQRGVRTPRYKLIARAPFATPLEVYDLQADPKELDNLAKDGVPLPDEMAALVPLLKPNE